MKILYAFFFLDLMNAPIFMSAYTKHVFSLGGSNIHMGMIGTSNAILGFILKSVAGRLSDTRGTSKILLWCLTLSAVGNILTAFSPSLFIFFIARTICVFGAPVQALLNTVLTSLKKESQSAFLNKLGVCIGVAIVFGALIGGFISEFEHGIFLSYLLMTFNTLLSIALLNQLPSAKDEKKEKKKPTGSFYGGFKSTIHNLKNVFLSDRYWEVMAIKAFYEISTGMVNTNFVYMMSTVFGMHGREMGYFISFFCICGIMSNVIQMKVNDIIYPNDKGYVKIFHGSVLTSIGYMGITFTSSYYLFILSIFITCIGRSLLEPAIMQLLLSKVDEKEKGTVMSSFDSIRSLSELVHPIATGTMVETFGPRSIYPVCASLAAAIASISVLRKK
ncbi:hypothetical protein JTB14_034067 [Gonioctena quinquepunctata]|nr:hypothetical protein JTB14_034067 [Gonioctena quinquepunctata]